MNNSFNISLIINGGLDKVKNLDGLKKYGKISFYKKGEHFSRLSPPLEQDFFKFTYSIIENHEKNLIEFADIIKSLDLHEYRKCDLRLRIYIQSFDAQIMFILSKKMIKILHDLNLDVEISILSWGEVSN